MEIKDIKIGDKVQLRKDIPKEKLTKLLVSHGLRIDNALELQRRGEVTVKGLQPGNLEDDEDSWDSITLEGLGYFWPVKLFEPVNKSNKKSKEEQVQEDIEKIKGIVKRYGLTEQGGPAMALVKWLEDFGQDNLIESWSESV